jgi:hypothetical protein
MPHPPQRLYRVMCTAVMVSAVAPHHLRPCSGCLPGQISTFNASLPARPGLINSP